ncbi:MAG: HK97 family phage prohead protease [Muribaculaceae bacterium]|nr:HK97 family phage prohead protease [Muribaculaceae bacterium]
MKISRRTIPAGANLRIREVSEQEQSRTIEGTAIVFNAPSVPMYSDDELEIREVIAPEAITDEILRSSDILMTLYHNNERILARSNRGQGTLNYERTNEGVTFSFDAPDTEDGRVALALVRSGDIGGCSFAFTIDEDNPGAIGRTSEEREGKTIVTYTVRKILRLYDFTLTPRPAYESTEVATRMRDEWKAGKEAKAAEAVQAAKDAEYLNSLASRY